METYQSIKVSAYLTHVRPIGICIMCLGSPSNIFDPKSKGELQDGSYETIDPAV